MGKGFAAGRKTRIEMQRSIKWKGEPRVESNPALLENFRTLGVKVRYASALTGEGELEHSQQSLGQIVIETDLLVCLCE